jgi:hypothetical protein
VTACAETRPVRARDTSASRHRTHDQRFI